MIKFWMLVVLVILCLIGIAIFVILLFDDYVANLNLEISQLKQENNDLEERIEKVLALIGNPLDNYWEEEAQCIVNLLKEGK